MEPITFHRLTDDDVGLLSTWLRTRLVARWWADDPAPDAIRAEYAAALGDTLEHGEVLVARADGIDVGLLQWYRLDGEPDYLDELSRVVDVDPATASIDYLVGVPDLIGTGIGARIVAAGLRRVWAAEPAVEHVLVPVAAGNRRSWRTLEKAGMTRIAEGDLEPDNPIDGPEHVLYRVSRPADLR